MTTGDKGRWRTGSRVDMTAEAVVARAPNIPNRRRLGSGNLGLDDCMWAGGQGLVSQTHSLLPLSFSCRRTTMRLVRPYQRLRLGRGCCTPARQPAGERESSSECERVRPRVRAQQHYYHYCIYQINTLSACRRRCKTSLPVGVDAESLTWDMGRGPPVAPELWVQAAAVVIHGAVGLVPVEIELVSALRAAVCLLVAAERHRLAQRET